MPETLEKVSAARDERARKRLDFVIEVDGGIGDATARSARAAGADVFVAGHAVFRAPDPSAALAGLRAAVAG
jgi:ribulose-phosphate 3-epimerase